MEYRIKKEEIVKESSRVYNTLLRDFETSFKWIDLTKAKTDTHCEGLPTILMDFYISDQVIKKIPSNGERQEEIDRFFSYIEELLNSSDFFMIDCINTTLLEKIASEETIKLEYVLPHCKKKTIEMILELKRSIFGSEQRANELSMKFVPQ